MLWLLGIIALELLYIAVEFSRRGADINLELRRLSILVTRASGQPQVRFEHDPADQP